MMKRSTLRDVGMNSRPPLPEFWGTGVCIASRHQTCACRGECQTWDYIAKRRDIISIDFEQHTHTAKIPDSENTSRKETIRLQNPEPGTENPNQ